MVEIIQPYSTADDDKICRNIPFEDVDILYTLEARRIVYREGLATAFCTGYNHHSFAYVLNNTVQKEKWSQCVPELSWGIC